MPRDCGFKVAVKKLDELRSCLEEVAQQPYLDVGVLESMKIGLTFG